MLRYIEYLLYVFVFLLPWQARVVLSPGMLNGGYWEYGSVSLYAIDVLFFVLLALSGVWFITNRASVIARNGVVKSSFGGSPVGRQSLVVVALIAYAFVSIFWSSNHVGATYTVAKLLEGVALFFILSYLPVNRSRLLWALVASAVVQSILVIAQFATQTVFAWPFSGIASQDPMTPGVAVVEAGGRRWLRAYGSFPHPNLLGGYLAMTLLLGLRQWRSMTARGYWLFAIGYSLSLIGLFLTFSRAAWIALVVGVAMWIIQQRAWRVPAIRIGGVTIIAIGILYAALFWPLIASRVTGIGRLELKSTSERMQYIGESITLIRDHALFGVGIGNYTSAVHEKIRPGDPSWSYQPVHNVFLLVFAELGIVGFLLFVLFLSKFITHNSQLIIPLFLLLLLDHSFWTLHSGILLFWLIMAFLINKESKALDVI